jgi:hypothetical protein
MNPAPDKRKALFATGLKTAGEDSKDDGHPYAEAKEENTMKPMDEK